MAFGELHNRYRCEPLFLEACICRGCFTDNLKYDWLMIMYLGGSVVSFFHVTYYDIEGESHSQIWLRWGNLGF